MYQSSLVPLKMDIGSMHPTISFPDKTKTPMEKERKSPSKVMFPSTRTILWNRTAMGEVTYLNCFAGHGCRLSINKETLHLAHRQLQVNRAQDFCGFFVGEINIKQGEMLIEVNRYDPGRNGQCNANTFRFPVTSLPGDINIQVTLCAGKGFETQLHSNEDFKSIVKEIESWYSRKDKLEIANMFRLQMKCNFFVENNQLFSLVSCECVSPSDLFQMQSINNIPIIQTTLARSLPSNTRQQTGFLTMDQTRKLLLLVESDPKVASFPLVGVWVNGIRSNLLIYCAMLRFVHSQSISERVSVDGEFYLLLLFENDSPFPTFYEFSKEISTSGFQLSSFSEKIQMQNGDTVGRYSFNLTTNKQKQHANMSNLTTNKQKQHANMSNLTTNKQKQHANMSNFTSASKLDDSLPFSPPLPKSATIERVVSPSVPDLSLCDSSIVIDAPLYQVNTEPPKKNEPIKSNPTELHKAVKSNPTKLDKSVKNVQKNFNEPAKSNVLVDQQNREVIPSKGDKRPHGFPRQTKASLARMVLNKQFCNKENKMPAKTTKLNKNDNKLAKTNNKLHSESQINKSPLQGKLAINFRKTSPKASPGREKAAPPQANPPLVNLAHEETPQLPTRQQVYDDTLPGGRMSSVVYVPGNYSDLDDDRSFVFDDAYASYDQTVAEDIEGLNGEIGEKFPSQISDKFHENERRDNNMVMENSKKSPLFRAEVENKNESFCRDEIKDGDQSLCQNKDSSIDQYVPSEGTNDEKQENTRQKTDAESSTKNDEEKQESKSETQTLVELVMLQQQQLAQLQSQLRAFMTSGQHTPTRRSDEIKTVKSQQQKQSDDIKSVQSQQQKQLDDIQSKLQLFLESTPLKTPHSTKGVQHNTPQDTPNTLSTSTSVGESLLLLNQTPDAPLTPTRHEENNFETNLSDFLRNGDVRNNVSSVHDVTVNEVSVGGFEESVVSGESGPQIEPCGTPVKPAGDREGWNVSPKLGESASILEKENRPKPDTTEFYNVMMENVEQMMASQNIESPNKAKVLRKKTEQPLEEQQQHYKQQYVQREQMKQQQQQQLEQQQKQQQHQHLEQQHQQQQQHLEQQQKLLQQQQQDNQQNQYQPLQQQQNVIQQQQLGQQQQQYQNHHQQQQREQLGQQQQQHQNHHQQQQLGQQQHQNHHQQQREQLGQQQQQHQNHHQQQREQPGGNNFILPPSLRTNCLQKFQQNDGPSMPLQTPPLNTLNQTPSSDALAIHPYAHPTINYLSSVDETGCSYSDIDHLAAKYVDVRYTETRNKTVTFEGVFDENHVMRSFTCNMSVASKHYMQKYHLENNINKDDRTEGGNILDMNKLRNLPKLT